MTRAGTRARREELAFAALLFFAALAPRLWVATVWAGEPVWDGHYYDFGAKRIAAGLGYSDDRAVDGHAVWHPWCHYPVGFSAALALAYWAFGSSARVAAVFDAGTGALLAVATWALARHAFGETRARIAGAIVAFHPGLVLYAGLLMTEPLAALLTVFSFWLAVRDRARPARGLVLGALALGVAALVRPQALLCAPFLPLALGAGPTHAARAVRRVWGWRPSARWLGAIGVACALALVPVIPWTARNCRVMDGCALVSTNAGWNLAIGAFPRATGRFETLRSDDGCRDVTGQVQQDRCWFSYGMAHIRKTPGRWLGLIPAKLGFTFDHESFAVEYLHQARPNDWPEARRARWRDVTSTAHRILVVLAALGCVGFASRGRKALVQGALLAACGALVYLAVSADAPTFWPLVVFACVVPWLPLPGASPRAPAMSMALGLLATTVVTHAVFFGEDRYHVVTVPALAMLAAGILRRAPGTLRHTEIP